MPRLSLGLGVQTIRKFGGGGAPIIWKVAIFGAGTTTSNGEYAWDGVTITNGKPQYNMANGSNIFWYPDSSEWILADNLEGIDAYKSTNLTTWTSEGGSLPVPSSTLSYSENSYIQTVVLAGGDPDQSGTYTWNGTTFVNGKPRYVGPLKSSAPTNNSIQFTGTEYILNGYYPAGEEMIDQSASTDLAANWTTIDSSTSPTVSSIIYTA